jgi:hypothetical protein
MSWSCRLKRPLGLNDGRRLETLEDARWALLELSQLSHQNEHCELASRLLMKAVEGNQPALDEFAVQLTLALKAESLI